MTTHKIKRIAILLKSKKVGAEKAAKTTIKFFRDRNYQIFTKLNRIILKNGLDFVLIIGGDGTILHIANQIATYNTPLIGVNFGYKGYLCQIAKNNLDKGLRILDRGKYFVKSYTRIMAKVLRENRIVKKIDALNEIVVGGINRMVWLKLKIKQKNQKKSAILIGDGIIFSTRIGSTAYNIYAGGPVLLTDVFSVVAINSLVESNYFLPHTKSFVVPIDTIFEVMSIRGGKNLPYVIADGQKDFRLQTGDKIIVEKSPFTTKLIEIKK